jgi:hypothetical protein
MKMNALDNLNEKVADHRVDEFYAWNDFRTDFRSLKVAANVLADGMDDLGTDLSEGLDALLDFSGIEEIDSTPDLSRYELRRQEWQ